MGVPAGCTEGRPWKKTLRSRYVVHESGVLGEGATGTVYKGLDLKLYKNVAVKVYNAGAGDIADLNYFKASVQVCEALHAKHVDRNEVRSSLSVRRSTVRGSERMWSKETADSAGITRYATDDFLDHLDVRACFVKLLDYSRTETGEPGFDAEDEILFQVFELGGESLEDRLDACAQAGRNFSKKELRELQWALVSIVWGLHVAGYVHLDIKPKNVVWFPGPGVQGQWKLIDLDGAVRTGSRQRLETLTFTAHYMPPELAAAVLPTRGSRHRREMTVSRLMDVWSVGMCAMEAIFLQPVLEPVFKEWIEETGEPFKFFEWLGDYEGEPIVSGEMREHIASIDEDMVDLLEGMLAKNPAKRFCISQCLAHCWFEPIRSELLKDIQRPDHQRPEEEVAHQAKVGGPGPLSASRACSIM